LKLPSLVGIEESTREALMNDGRSKRRATTTRVGLLRAALLSSACGTIACSSVHIARFEVAPRHICAGQDVHIAWDVTGSARLTVTPSLPGAPGGGVSSSGQATIRPMTDTRISLRTSRWLGGSAGADVDVEVARGAPVEIAASLQDSPTCQGGQLVLRTEVKGFAGSLRAELVGAGKRALDISREGEGGHIVTAHVAPGQPATSAFAQLPMNGLWTISSALLPGESCSSPPHVLTAIAHTACNGGEP
jgi:hypothetical protein